MHITDRIAAVLLVGTLTTGLYAGSFIDWNSEDAQQNPLAFLNQKETIRVWYGDEALTDYINSAAVAFGEAHNVRVLPYYIAENDYLETINRATLGEEQDLPAMPDAYLISHDLLEKAYLAGLAVPVEDAAGVMY